MSNIKIKPRHMILVLSAAVLILFLRFVIFPPKFLPGEFSDARIKGAEIAGKIVELSRDTLSQLDQVSQYDQKRKAARALAAIAKALDSNRESQIQAIQLSSQLTAMAENIPRVQPADARYLATEAVTAETTLVSRLIYYNNYLTQLFEALKVKFQNPDVQYLDGQVNDLINKINDEAKAINLLNKQFTSTMAEFDAIFGN